MIDRCNWPADKVTGVIRVCIQGDLELIVFLVVDNQDINRICLALDFVFIQQVNVECRTLWISGAYDGVPLCILDDKLGCRGVSFGEIDVIGSVLKSASAIFCAGIASGVRAGKYRYINLV